MITAFLIQMLAGIVSGLFSLIPSFGGDDSSITSVSGQVGTLTHSLNDYVPETMLFACFGLLLAVRVLLLAWRAVVFVYSMLPFVG